MALHKDLTGAELHEPKGAATAASGTVYVANGSGSGAWTSKDASNFNLNKYWMQGSINDISTPSARAFIYVPVSSVITSLSAILDAPITTANSILSIYINGVLFADSLTIIQAGSFAGQLQRINVNTVNSVPADSIVEIRSNGASDSVALTNVILGLRAQA